MYAHMFDRKYKIKVYNAGQDVPITEFVVVATYIDAKGHTLDIDGIHLQFNQDQYITTELVRG